ncbi:hypothetical protein [Alkanindiges illinoisensis]|uniref:hypothetical protein n=1 Tax=Alkanindiges illinoisensis TaxID=197183 RepID=UPI00068583A4|nr:hypothetical protein [Alkanindiges illinoisensis]
MYSGKLITAVILLTLSHEAFAQVCSAAKLANILSSTHPLKQDVAVDCDLTLNKGQIVSKKIVIKGSGASGTTINCNSAQISDVQIKSEKVIDPATGNINYSKPENITIQGCTVLGSISIRNGLSSDEIVKASRQQDYVSMIRSIAPSNITLKNLNIQSKGATPLYVFPGVNHVQLIDSMISGKAKSAAVYLDAESINNVIQGNIFKLDTGRELIAIDGSEKNTITNNKFYHVGTKGGIYLYRNCGERQQIRHTMPSYNQIIANDFYYDTGISNKPAVYVGSRDGHSSWCKADQASGKTTYTFGSSLSNLDHAQFNIIKNNKIHNASLINAIKTNNPTVNSNNSIHENKIFKAGE